VLPEAVIEEEVEVMQPQPTNDATTECSLLIPLSPQEPSMSPERILNANHAARIDAGMAGAEEDINIQPSNDIALPPVPSILFSPQLLSSNSKDYIQRHLRTHSGPDACKK
jgi:hypothetical protein